MNLDAHAWDAVVVGAGPAGAMTAFELARAGADVLLLDRQAPPRWKVCGCCLSPGAQAVLAEAGLASVLVGNRAVPLHTLRLAGWSRVADIPLGPSVALSRAALDLSLVRAACEAGAVLAAPARARPGPCGPAHRAVSVELADARVQVRARVVVAADGIGSPFLSEALRDGGAGRGAGERVRPGAPIGFGARYPGATAGYGAGVIHMAVGEGGYVGLVRLEDGSLDVAAALDATAAGRPAEAVRRLLEGAAFPALGGEPSDGWRGTPRLTRRLPTRGADRLFAVGDAAGYVEPFTGEGIGWALAGARTLAPIALEGIREWRADLVRAWDRAHERTVGEAARLCRAVSWTLRHPVLTRAGLAALTRVPGLAAPFVARAGRAPLEPSRRAS